MASFQLPPSSFPATVCPHAASRILRESYAGLTTTPPRCRIYSDATHSIKPWPAIKPQHQNSNTTQFITYIKSRTTLNCFTMIPDTTRSTKHALATDGRNDFRFSAVFLAELLVETLVAQYWKLTCGPTEFEIDANSSEYTYLHEQKGYSRGTGIGKRMSSSLGF